MSCVKITEWSKVVEEGTNTLIFYIFEYVSESGAECNAESGAFVKLILVLILVRKTLRLFA